jgi:short-subunit dehydrogenase
LYSFKGKVVWITGASSGIGEQLCYQFAQAGASIILSARSYTNLERVQSKLSGFGAKSRIILIDLELLNQLPDKVDDALACFGRIDILVNNAGIGLRDFALATSLMTDRKIMNVNYFGPMVLTKELLPHMIERQFGQVVVTSSLSGKYGVPRTSAYAASKHALHGFFESLRSELVGSGVFITIIVPGIIQTDITAHALKGDGTLFDRVEATYQSAYSTEKAAKKILQAIIKKKEEVFIGGNEGITLLLQRLSPWLMRRFIRNHPIKRWRKLKRRLNFWKK